MNVKAMICGHMTSMPLVDSNIKTVWVEITGKIIKRHRVKHRVEERLAVEQIPDSDVDIVGRAFYVPWYIRAWNWVMNILRNARS